MFAQPCRPRIFPTWLNHHLEVVEAVLTAGAEPFHIRLMRTWSNTHFPCQFAVVDFGRSRLTAVNYYFFTLLWYKHSRINLPDALPASLVWDRAVAAMELPLLV